MDYKTTFLKEELKTDSDLLPEISGLHFGILGENKAVFDYTAYIEENKLTNIDYKVVMRECRYFIENLAKSFERETSEFFFQNTNGHILISAELVFIVVAFVNPEMCAYFNSLLTDAISDGIAFSHGFVFSMAADKLPTEVMKEIINERINDSAGNNQ